MKRCEASVFEYQRNIFWICKRADSMPCEIPLCSANAWIELQRQVACADWLSDSCIAGTFATVGSIKINLVAFFLVRRNFLWQTCEQISDKSLQQHIFFPFRWLCLEEVTVTAHLEKKSRSKTLLFDCFRDFVWMDWAWIFFAVSNHHLMRSDGTMRYFQFHCLVPMPKLRCNVKSDARASVQLLLQSLGGEIPLSGPFSPTCCLIYPTFASTLKLW